MIVNGPRFAAVQCMAGPADVEESQVVISDQEEDPNTAKHRRSRLRSKARKAELAKLRDRLDKDERRDKEHRDRLQDRLLRGVGRTRRRPLLPGEKLAGIPGPGLGEATPLAGLSARRSAV